MGELSRTVVVTGAGRGIGQATAIRLTHDGWVVVAVDADDALLDQLRRDLPGVPTVHGDVADVATLLEARRLAESRGVLGAWVNNAVVNYPGRLDESTPEHIDHMLAVNLRAPLIGCQIAVQSYLGSKTPGAIVNLSSIHARAGFPGFPVYDMCKGGIEALTRHICVEYGPLGIRCNAIAPGAVMTQGTEDYIRSSQDPGKTRSETLALSPMNRAAQPHDIASAVSYLLSDEAAMINGHVLVVDGGATARCFGFSPDPELVGSAYGG